MSNVKSLAYIDNIVNTTLELWLDQADQRTGYEYFNYIDKPDLASWDIAEAIYAGLGKKPPALKIPYAVAKVLAIPFDLIIAATGKNLPVSSARIRKLAKATTQFDSSKIQSVTKFETTPLAEAIQSMVKWYLSEGKTATHPNRRPAETVTKS